MIIWNVLLLLLLILPTIHYRVNLSSFSFNTVEPFVLLTTFLLFGTYLYQRKQVYILKSPIFLIIAAILMWTVLIRPWAIDWQNGLSDIRDWLLPILIFLILNLLARKKWDHWYQVLVVWMFLLGIFGIIQHFINGARPFVDELASYKLGFDIFTNTAEQQLSRVSYAVGFSSHPNSYGLFLLSGLLITLGWAVKQKMVGILRLFIFLIIAMGLYWSYAKTSILIAFALVFIFILIWRVKSPKLLGLILAFFGILGISMITYLLPRLPETSLSTYWWRVGLWKIALEVITQYPQILVWGNGIDIFAQYAYFYQPHNLYIEYLLQYGLIGLTLLIALLIVIVLQGWKYYKNGWFQKDPRLLGLWLGLLSYFLVGMTESTFLDIEKRAFFLILLAAFEGLGYKNKGESLLTNEDNSNVDLVRV